MRPSEFDEWPEHDRDEAMALLYLEEQRCACGCGQYVDEAHSVDWNWDAKSRRCYAGQALDINRRMYDKANEGITGAHDGLLWHLERVTPKSK